MITPQGISMFDLNIIVPSQAITLFDQDIMMTAQDITVFEKEHKDDSTGNIKV